MTNGEALQLLDDNTDRSINFDRYFKFLPGIDAEITQVSKQGSQQIVLSRLVASPPIDHHIRVSSASYDQSRTKTDNIDRYRLTDRLLPTLINRAAFTLYITFPPVATNVGRWDGLL